MQSTWKLPTLMCGLGISLAPAVGDAAVVYRTSGVVCRPELDTLGSAQFSPESGLIQTSDGSSGETPDIACVLPTSDATLTPSTLTKVNIRYHVSGTASLTGHLVFHDYDSPDYVECAEDVDVVTTTQFNNLELTKSCSASSYESNWGVVPAIRTTGLTLLETLTIKVVTAYD